MSGGGDGGGDHSSWLRLLGKGRRIGVEAAGCRRCCSRGVGLGAVVALERGKVVGIADVVGNLVVDVVVVGDSCLVVAGEIGSSNLGQAEDLAAVGVDIGTVVAARCSIAVLDSSGALVCKVCLEVEVVDIVLAVRYSADVTGVCFGRWRMVVVVLAVRRSCNSRSQT